VSNAPPDPAKFTCGAPQGSALSSLPLNTAMSQLSVELNQIEDLGHALFPDEPTVLCMAEDKDIIQRELQQVPDTIEHRTHVHFMELGAPKTKFTFLGVPYQNQLRRRVRGARLGEERFSRPPRFDLQPTQGFGAHAKATPRAATNRLGKPRSVTGET
jgi:hypothetical protein